MKKIILIIFLLALTSTMQAQSSSSLLLELSGKKASLPIPTPKDALFYLDGTITLVDTNYYFKDKTTNNRDFLITDYDFNSDWTKGFPYKSAATISAPIGDTVLITADVNNFFYAADSTPNQLYVINFFQDIEYAHKVFSKHTERILNADSVEIYEPRVSGIAMYGDARSGADLTSCQSYFGVPTENTTTMAWLSTSGNDVSGDGSKSNPYATLNKIKATTKTTVYIKNGSYVFSSAMAYTGTDLEIIGTGLVNIASSGQYCTVGRNLAFKHCYIDHSGYGYSMIVTKAITFESCRLYKSDNYNFVTPNAGMTNLIARHCIFDLIHSNNGLVDDYSSFSGITIDGCIGSVNVHLNSPNYIDSSAISYSKFTNTTIELTSLEKLRIFNNVISNSTQDKIAIKIIGVNDQNNSNSTIKYNFITANNSNGYIFYIGATEESGYNAFNGVIFENNKIVNNYVGTMSNTSHDLFVGGGIDNSIRYNYISSGNGYNMVVKAGGRHYTNSNAHISYNILISTGPLRHVIYNRGAYGVNFVNNTIVGFNGGNSIINSDDDGAGFDDSIYVSNNLTTLGGNVNLFTQGTYAVSNYNSINKMGYTLTEALTGEDKETSVTLNSNGLQSAKEADGEEFAGDNVGLSSSYSFPSNFLYSTQGVNWQRGAILLP